MTNKSIQVDDELMSLLCINGCQQRTAGYNEAKQGKDGLDADDMERLEKIAYKQVEALIQQKQLETAKAYGGCTKCYGKGYATHIDATTAYADFGDEFGGAQSQKTIKHEMLFCTCERGRQLEVLLSTPPKKEDI